MAGFSYFLDLIVHIFLSSQLWLSLSLFSSLPVMAVAVQEKREVETWVFIGKVKFWNSPSKITQIFPFILPSINPPPHLLLQLLSLSLSLSRALCYYPFLFKDQKLTRSLTHFPREICAVFFLADRDSYLACQDSTKPSYQHITRYWLFCYFYLHYHYLGFLWKSLFFEA